VHPAKPKIGLRTTRANQMWHIDTTVIRLLDGTRTYLHAVIDNFSRRILDSWAPRENSQIRDAQAIFRLISVQWRRQSVEGFRTMAERTSRSGAATMPMAAL
jgi:transposase InsO family protein